MSFPQKGCGKPQFWMVELLSNLVVELLRYGAAHVVELLISTWLNYSGTCPGQWAQVIELQSTFIASGRRTGSTCAGSSPTGSPRTSSCFAPRTWIPST